MILQDPAGVLQVPERNDWILLQEKRALQDPGKLLQDSCKILQGITGFSCKILLNILAGSFAHNGLVAVEKQPLLIIYVDKEDGRTLCNSWK